MLDLSPEKLIVLLAVGLVVLGPRRLPEAARVAASAVTRAKQLLHAFIAPVDSLMGQSHEAVSGLAREVQTTFGSEQLKAFGDTARSNEDVAMDRQNEPSRG